MNCCLKYYIIEMTNECNHPNDKIVLTQEGEYVCSACGTVLTLDQASERRVYIQPEAIGYIDPHGKTNPWLLGLGSVIPKSYLTKLTKKHKLDSEDDSNFANVIAELALERYGQELMDSFHTYIKSKKDYPVAAYLAVMKVNNEYNLDLDSRDVKEAVNKHFKCSLSFIPSVTVQKMCRVARRFGARLAYQLSYY